MLQSIYIYPWPGPCMGEKETKENQAQTKSPNYHLLAFSYHLIALPKFFERECHPTSYDNTSLFSEELDHAQDWQNTMAETKMAGGRSITEYERNVGIYFMDLFSRVIDFDFETDSGHHIDAKVNFCNYDTLMKDVQEQINTKIRGADGKGHSDNLEFSEFLNSKIPSSKLSLFPLYGKTITRNFSRV